jgi:hypothetical protein
MRDNTSLLGRCLKGNTILGGALLVSRHPQDWGDPALCL